MTYRRVDVDGATADVLDSDGRNIGYLYKLRHTGASWAAFYGDRLGGAQPVCVGRGYRNRRDAAEKVWEVHQRAGS